MPRCMPASLVDGLWALDTARGRVVARTVVNCAGLYRRSGRRAPARQVRLRDPPAQGPVRRVRQGGRTAAAQHHPAGAQRAHERDRADATVFGNLLVGPTAEEQDDRDHATVDARRRSSPDPQRRRDGAGTGGHAGHRHLCRPAAGDRAQGISDPSRARPQLAHRGRHPLDRADGGAGAGPPCVRAVPRRRHRLTCRSTRPSGHACPTSPSIAHATGRPRPRRDRLPLRAGHAAARSRLPCPARCRPAIPAG